MCAGYIGDTCGVYIDSRPVITLFVNGDTCVVNGNRRCNKVLIVAFFFAINPMFSCKVVVSILLSSRAPAGFQARVGKDLFDNFFRVPTLVFSLPTLPHVTVAHPAHRSTLVPT